MSKRAGTLLVSTVAMLAVLLAPAVANGANFEPTSGIYEVDTTTLKLTGPGTEITGTDQGGVAVFNFDKVNIGPVVTIEAFGVRPLKFVASGELVLAGVIEAGGFSGEDLTPGAGEGGPGGGEGGADGEQPGSGPGGGGIASDESNGGGGGGFGGAGARGGVKSGNPGTAGPGGAPYGDLNAALQGGSGGAGGSLGGEATGGGGGGGAVALFGATVRIAPEGEVNVDGGNGAVGEEGGSGGGSGGGILLHAQVLQVNGALSARGGGGGRGGCCGAGGGGGGGRIAYQFGTLIASGSPNVSGGASSSISTTNCCTGTTGASPQPFGAEGVVTKLQAPLAITGLATGLGSTGVTLNAVVNPNSNATTYHFEFGATTAYGLRTPAVDAAVGSDAANHAVSQAITGLAPNVTYHYRVVATDAIGFTTNGVDVTFKTPACIVPKLKGKKLKAARKALKKANCSAGKVKRRFSGKVKKGRVIKQTVKPGKVLSAGAKVGIKASKGKK